MLFDVRGWFDKIALKSMDIWSRGTFLTRNLTKFDNKYNIELGARLKSIECEQPKWAVWQTSRLFEK